MRSTRLTTALACVLTIAATLAAPAAYAMPVDQSAPGATREASDAPPPPSSIAASAAEVVREAARGPGASQPVAAEPSAPGGFDWVSAAIGAVAAAGVAVVSMAMLGMRKPGGPARRERLSTSLAGMHADPVCPNHSEGERDGLESSGWIAWRACRRAAVGARAAGDGVLVGGVIGRRCLSRE